MAVSLLVFGHLWTGPTYAQNYVLPIPNPPTSLIFTPPPSPPNSFWNTIAVNVAKAGIPASPGAEAYYGIRTSGTSWASLEPSRGTYNWPGIEYYSAPGQDYLYTFAGVPTWANKQTLTITGFSSTTSAITFIAANNLIVSNTVTVSGIASPYSSLDATYTVTARTPTQFTVSASRAATAQTAIAGTAAFAGTAYQAPIDLYTNGPCKGVLSGTTTTDCSFKEFVTAFMQQNCPTGPSSCVIRNFESWNEFNTNGSWDDSYANLAVMAEDAATIVRQYCNSCLFGAGSVSGGGAGWNDSQVNTRNPAHPNWTYYDEALGDFLLDWQASGVQGPDFINWHAYAAIPGTGSTALTPQPMPEFSYSGDGSGDGGDAGSSWCTIANQSRTTNKYCIDSILIQANTIAAFTNTGAYGVQGKPYWATEGGFDTLASLTNSDNNDANPLTQPACSGAFNPLCTADVLRAAFLARWLILLEASGVSRAYWYSWDDPCWGTLYGMAPTGVGTAGATLVNCSAANYGQTINTVYGAKTLAGTAWDQVQSWLNGASTPTGCAEDPATSIFSCTITRNQPAGYQGVIAWYTTWLTSPSYSPPAYTPPAGTTQYRTLSDPYPLAYNGGTITLGPEPIIFEQP